MANQETREASPAGSIDSLFDAREASASPLAPSPSAIQPASRSVPAVVDGLYLLKDVLSEEYVEQLLERVQKASYFDAPRGIDQVMLFGKARSPEGGAEQSSLPSWATELLSVLEEQTQARLDAATHCLLFNARRESASIEAKEDALARHFKRRKVKADIAHTQASSEFTASKEPRARQIILNLYAPGTGISSHCDLPGRYDDGIMGLSLGSGCVMDFTRSHTSSHSSDDNPECASLYLPSNSLIILTGPARWDWKHGIASREGDWVLDEPSDESAGADGEARYILRRPRLSITARWMKGDAHIVGEACEVTRNEESEKETSGVRETLDER